MYILATSENAPIIAIDRKVSLVGVNPDQSPRQVGGLGSYCVYNDRHAL